MSFTQSVGGLLNLHHNRASFQYHGDGRSFILSVNDRHSSAVKQPLMAQRILNDTRRAELLAQ